MQGGNEGRVVSNRRAGLAWAGGLVGCETKMPWQRQLVNT